MEEKATLMMDSQKVGLEMEKLQAKIAELEKNLQEIPARCRVEQAEAANKAMSAFNAERSRKLAEIEKITTAKKVAVSDLIDSMPDEDTTGPIGRHDIKELEDHLKKVYPPALIEDYKCLNPIEFDDDAEAEACYNAAEDAVLNLQRGNIAGLVFNGLSALLDKAADYPQLGMRVAGGMVVFTVAGLILSPFLFLTVFTLLGVTCGIHGALVQSLLRKIYSVKLYMTNAYDVEEFEQEKAEIMDNICPFIESLREEAVEMINQETYTPDPDLAHRIQQKYDLETKRVQDALDNARQDYNNQRQKLEGMIHQLELIAEREKEVADVARQKYLQEITWKQEWLQGVFLDVTPENKIKMMRYAKGNTLYYAQTADPLKQLSRLVLWQSVLHMHPDYASNIVLDYKYNGGELVQFNGMSDRCIKLAYSEDDITTQMESMTNRIRSRTNNILSTCSSIEEYNELMSQYGTLGEYYVIVHIFGMNAISPGFLSNLRNGNRVGYFFKFYWTQEEMMELKDQLPLSEMKEIYEVGDNPVPRTAGAIRRILGITA